MNCLLWGVAAAGVVTGVGLLTYAAVVACWPVAFWFFLPTLNRTREEVLLACMMTGVNAFVWGYGLSWVLTLMKGRPGPESDRRGFEVITDRPAGTPHNARG